MKNLAIAGVVGVFFMAGGFWYGLKLKPIPVAKAVAAPVIAAPDITAPVDPISIEALQKTSESMMALNNALKLREEKVAAREQKVSEREDELAAERAALDRSHEKFKILFSEFQQRLQLVEASQLEQTQKQADLYASMGTAQSIELIRAMEDPEMIRLFSVMDVKPLGKLIAEWKAKYPEDTPRLLHALDGMAQVLPKDKIALSDAAAEPDPGSGSPTPPVPNAPAAPGSDGASPSPTGDVSTSPAPDPNTSASAPNPPPAPDATPSPAQGSSTPTDPVPPPPLNPPPDSSPAPTSTATSN